MAKSASFCRPSWSGGTAGFLGVGCYGMQIWLWPTSKIVFMGHELRWIVSYLWISGGLLAPPSCTNSFLVFFFFRYLYKNHISDIDRDAFNGLTNLEQLWVSVRLFGSLTIWLNAVRKMVSHPQQIFRETKKTRWSKLVDFRFTW